MAIRRWFAAAVFGFVLVTGAAAQLVEVQAVKLTSGATHHGRVTETPDSVIIELASGGRLTVSRAQVVKITTVRGRSTNGEFWTEDVNQTRLFFAPTARTLPKGDGYLSVYELFLPFVGYGVTDQLTLAGGILPLFGSDLPLVMYIAPKLQLFDEGRVQMAVGGLSFFASESDESVGILYGVASFGQSSDHSLSVGAGFGYAGSDLENSPVLLVGGESRGSSRIKMITENWFFPGEGGAGSLGVRFLGERLSGDLGLGMVFGSGSVLFPLVNFVWNW